MRVIERAAELGVVIHIEIGVAELQEAAHLPLSTAGSDVLGMIGVSEIGSRWREHQNFGPVFACFALARRANEEGDIVLARRLAAVLSAFSMERRGSALEIGREGEVDRGLPARIIDVVAVEMDGAILFGLPCPAMLL